MYTLWLQAHMSYTLSSIMIFNSNSRFSLMFHVFWEISAMSILETAYFIDGFLRANSAE